MSQYDKNSKEISRPSYANTLDDYSHKSDATKEKIRYLDTDNSALNSIDPFGIAHTAKQQPSYDPQPPQHEAYDPHPKSKGSKGYAGYFDDGGSYHDKQGYISDQPFRGGNGITTDQLAREQEDEDVIFDLNENILSKNNEEPPEKEFEFILPGD